MSRRPVEKTNPGNDRFSILVREKSTSCYNLFVRGNSEQMKNILDFNRAGQFYHNVLKKNKESGLESVIYAKKAFDEKSVGDIVERYKKIIQTSLDIEGDLSALATSIEKNLTLVAVLGIKNTLREDAQLTISRLQEMGVKVHMLTGDKFDNAVNTATFLGIIKDKNLDDGYVLLDFEDENDGLVKIREVLDEFKTAAGYKKKPTGRTMLAGGETFSESAIGSPQRSRVQPKLSFSHTTSGGNSPIRLDRKTLTSRSQLDTSRYSIPQGTYMLTGRTMEVISTNSHLYNHVAFILQYANSIVGYCMKPMHKRDLLAMMKKVNRSKNIMSVGDGFNDIPMLQYADIGVQILTDKSYMIYGDIVVKHLALLPKLMCCDGASFSSSLRLAVFDSYYYSLLIGNLLFFYQFYCDFTSAAVLQPGLIYATYASFNFIAALYSVMENVYSEAMRVKVPALYSEQSYFARTRLRNVVILVSQIYSSFLRQLSLEW